MDILFVLLPNLIRQTDKLIQVEFPNAKPFEREQLVSGICSDKCWDKIFK